MDISRRLGILVIFGVPAIIGGVICFNIFNSYPSVFVYECMLYLFAGGIVSK